MSKRDENPFVRVSEDPDIILWRVGTDHTCTHPTGEVDYVGDDGRNLFFQCGKCGVSLVAQEAIHLLN